jgi:hypothetical protein
MADTAPLAHHFLEQIFNVHWGDEGLQPWCESCDGFMKFEPGGGDCVQINLNWGSDTFSSSIFLNGDCSPAQLANDLGIQWEIFMNFWCSAPGAGGCPSCTSGDKDTATAMKSAIATALSIKSNVDAQVSASPGTSINAKNSSKWCTCTNCGGSVTFDCSECSVHLHWVSDPSVPTFVYNITWIIPNDDCDSKWNSYISAWPDLPESYHCADAEQNVAGKQLAQASARRLVAQAKDLAEKAGGFFSKSGTQAGCGDNVSLA